MHVLIVIDEVFASRERPMLERLEIGLADDGLRVTHAIPENESGDPIPGVFSQALIYPGRGMLVSTKGKVRELYKQIATLKGSEAQKIDIVHVFGGPAWRVGLELARQSGAAVALELWRAGLLRRAVSQRSGDPARPGPVFFAPDAALEKALMRERMGNSVRLTPWGVHTPSDPTPVLRENYAPTAMMIGPGRDAAAFARAFEGLAVAVRRRPDLLIFVDARAASRAQLWELARKLNVTPNVSIIEGMEEQRELVLQGDLLIIPEARGEQRTLSLEAMGNLMAVIAARDPMVSWLVDGRTARLIEAPSAQAWTDAALGLLDDPDSARALGTSAREYVREHHRASAHVASVLDGYEWMTSRDAMPFRPPTASG